MEQKLTGPVNGRWAGVPALCCLLALLLPVLIAPLPPLTDYPNHLARIWLLSAATPPMPGIYAAAWDTLTNVGIDALGMALSRVTDTWTAGRLIVALATMLVPLGGMLLWRGLHGRWHWWQASFAILAWGPGLLDGFLNFQIGLGLALLGGALDVALRRRGPMPAVAARVAMGVLILLAHPFGFVFYAALLMGIAIGPVLPGSRAAVWGRVGSVAVVGASLAVPLIAFLVLSPRLPAAVEGQGGAAGLVQEFVQGIALTVFQPMLKVSNLFVAVRSYSNPADALATLCLASPAVVALATRRVQVHAGLLLTAVGCLVAYVLCPFALAGALWVDARFTCMAPLALVLALRPALPGWAGRAMATVLVAGALGRTAFIGAAWQGRQADFAAVERALAPVPPGVAVFAVEHRIGPDAAPPLGRYLMTGESTMRHAVTLAIPWRRAFVPTLFAIRGQQPIRVLPPWDAVAMPVGGTLASVDVLAHPERYAGIIASRPYLRTWRESMDYVLVINADMADVNGPFVAPPALRLVSDAGFAQLFQVVR